MMPFQSEGRGLLDPPSPLVSPPLVSSLLEVMVIGLGPVPSACSEPFTVSETEGSNFTMIPGLIVSVNVLATLTLLRIQKTSASTDEPDPGMPQLWLADGIDVT